MPESQNISELLGAIASYYAVTISAIMTYMVDAKMPNWHFQMKKCQFHSESASSKKRGPFRGPLFALDREILVGKPPLRIYRESKIIRELDAAQNSGRSPLKKLICGIVGFIYQLYVLI